MTVATNARWIGLSQFARVALQLGSLAILARLLSPVDYGLMSMAVVVTTFAALFRDLGTAAAIIQQKELSEQSASTIFWLNVALGTALTAILILTAPWCEAWLRLPGLGRVLMALAPSFLFMGASSTHQAWMERRQDFRSLTFIEVSSGVAAVCLCIAAAAAGFGVYALVIQTVVQSAISSGLLWLRAGFSPRLVFRREELRAIGGFSGNLAAFNFINYFSRNADNVIIGRALGSAALGEYSLAYKLMMFPLQNMTAIAARAMFPVLSREHADGAASFALYLRTVRAIAFITAPLMATMFVLRRPLVRIAFGPQWDQAAELLLWLAPTGFIQSIVSTSGTVFMAKGKTEVLFALGILGAVLSVGAFLIGVRGGTSSLVQWYFVANLVNAPVVLIAVTLYQQRSLTILLRELFAPCCAGLVTGLAAYLGAFSLRLSPIYWREELAAHLLISAGTFAGLFLTLFRQDARAVTDFVRRRKASA